MEDLHGAGSTFVQPILKEWAYNWSTKSGVKITYDGGGSGVGISKAKAGDVDFGASDAPLGDEELAANNLVQFPIVAGGIVVIENISSLGRRRLQVNGQALADIFMGKITRWNDPELAALNPGAALPDTPITVVHRSEGSGTTYNFTAYLTRVSPAWAAKLGTGKTVSWPVGTGTEGNQNVANMVSNTPDSIGYVEYGYALAHNLRIATLHTASGGTVFPTQTTIRNAVDAADWAHASSFNLLLVGTEGKDVWPIAATTWVIIPNKSPNVQKTLEFFRWALDNGAELADAQGYTPLPPKLVKLVEKSWAKSFPAKTALASH
ncbi:MAG TPA: phosphate ABC transporter substrate-binding protein PstS [Rudaea sp.]|nr:phosphate ABC transporter substrate-binding protein PstS [Rudaea sp.]